MIRRVAAIAFVAVAACSGGDEPQAPEPRPAAPAPPESGSSGTGTAPAPAQPEVAPVEVGGGDATNGAKLYAQYCATCHGAGGKGDGPIGDTLVPKPADHTDAKYIGSLSDRDIFAVIQKGGASVGKSSLMAAWGAVLKDGDIRDLVAHIRSLSGT